MGKKEMMVKYQLLKIVLPIMVLFSINIQAQNNKMIFSFQSKSEIIEWGKKEFGFSISSDSSSYKIEDQNIFILIGDYGSGVQRKAIFVFLNNNIGKRDEWRLFCMRDTNTSEVYVEIDQKLKEIVFKAKSEKTLMILPFETLNLKFDFSKQ